MKFSKRLPAIGELGSCIDFVVEDNRRFGLGNNIDVWL